MSENSKVSFSCIKPDDIESQNCDSCNSSPTLEQKMRALPWVASQSPFHAFFCLFTIFGTVFVLFLDELKLDTARIGFLLSLIPFCSIISLFAAPWGPKMGTKRMFLIFYYLRSFAAVSLLFTPIILKFGQFEAFILIAVAIFIIAICRSIAETAVYSWQQEYIPDIVRGRMYAINSMLASVAGIVGVGFAGYVLKHGEGLDRFIILILIGAVSGVIATSCCLFIPGGRPEACKQENVTHLDGVIEVLRDKNFVLFLILLALANAGVAVIMYFVPLFLKQKVAVPIDRIMFLEVSTNIGAFLSVFFWGWAADRYGSKPIMLSSLLCLLFTPIFWAIFPREYNSINTLFAILIVFLFGAGSVGWMIGWCRYVYTGAMPVEKKTAYTSVLYAWIGVTGGLAPLLCGWIANVTKELNYHCGFVNIDSYVLLFILCFFGFIVSIILISYIKCDSHFTTLHFLRIIITGEPIFVAIKWLRNTCCTILNKG